ncbi:MAG TPA: 50S ribosomal protein L29 [Ktedonobacterales bacterium]|nr:50S ribosomal protein L29 [Ktedonobacterales bacterium]
MSKLRDRRRDVQAMDLATAYEELKTMRDKLFRLRLQHQRGEVKDNRQFPQTKKDVARLLHHIGELQHAAEVEAEGALMTTDEGNT